MKGLFPQKMKWDLIWVVIFFVFVLGVENFLVWLWANTVNGEPIGQSGRTYSIKGVYSVAMLCSGAASLVGGLIGFLFGIPQSSASNTVVERSSSRVGAIQRADTEAVGDAASSRQDLVQATSEAAAVTGRETAIGREAGQGSGLHRNTNLENISDALTKGLLAIGASQLYRVDGWVRNIAPVLGESFGQGGGGQIVGLSILTYGAIEGFLFGYLATRIYLTGVFERSDPKA